MKVLPKRLGFESSEVRLRISELFKKLPAEQKFNFLLCGCPKKLSAA